MMSDKFKLVGHEPFPVHDLMEWCQWMQDNKNNRHVGKDDVPEGRVSTVFLGLDHSFGDSGGPVLFETLVFGGRLDGEMERYMTWDEAEAGHKLMVQRCKNPEGTQR